MNAHVEIRPSTDADWPAIREIMEPVVRAGDTYPCATDMTVEGARQTWIDIPAATYVAEGSDGNLLGTYYIKPNQPTLGAPIANCGYIVSEQARGRGVATQMCQHSQDEAACPGYRAMQYKLVVKINEPGVHLWQKMGFEIGGTLPGTFRHVELGFVDAYVMYKELGS